MASVPKDLSAVAESPPLYRLLATAEVMGNEDGHLNPAWRGIVGKPDSTEPGIPMVIKYLGDSSIKNSIEIACGLAAIALRLPVPRPALVYCDSEDLPNLPRSVEGKTLLLFGSQLQPEDTLWVQAKASSVEMAELIWKKVCSLPIGAQGAAWDELIANPDRHHQNLIWDGVKWWLFDHDKAIPPALSTKTESDKSKLGKEFPEFIVRANLLALEMIKRYPADHKLDIQPNDFEKNKMRLLTLARLTETWRVEDPRVTGILNDASLLTTLIANRLPALSMHLQHRIGRKSGDSLWT
jgi:hypothetical protein